MKSAGLMSLHDEQTFWLLKLQSLQAADYEESRSSYQHLIDAVAGSEPIAEEHIQEAGLWERGLDTAGLAGLSLLFADLGDYLRRRRNREAGLPEETQ